MANPYVWAAQKAASGAITLTGFYPSDQVRAEINAAIRAANPGAQVTDQMLPAAGAPANLAAMAGVGAQQLSRLVEGRASLSNAAYSIVGRGPATFEACSAFRQGIAGQLAPGSTLAQSEMPARRSRSPWSGPPPRRPPASR